MVGVAGLTFCHEEQEQEDILWVKMIVLVAGIHLDIYQFARPAAQGWIGQISYTVGPVWMSWSHSTPVWSNYWSEYSVSATALRGIAPPRQDEYRDIDNPKGAAEQYGTVRWRISQTEDWTEWWTLLQSLKPGQSGWCRQCPLSCINGSHRGDSPHCRRGSAETDGHEALQIVTKPTLAWLRCINCQRDLMLRFVPRRMQPVSGRRCGRLPLMLLPQTAPKILNVRQFDCCVPFLGALKQNLRPELLNTNSGLVGVLNAVGRYASSDTEMSQLAT